MTKINAGLTDAFLTSALGDAWGYLHEFSSYQEIISQNSELPQRLKISDDTQMAIATFEATIDLLSHAAAPAGEATQTVSLPDEDGLIREVYTRHYLKWAVSPENNRAPGATVMSALSDVRRHVRPATEAATNDSLGCGTVMRTPVLAMFTQLSDAQIFRLAAVSSTTTHGDRLGHFVAALAPVFIRRLLTADLKGGKQAVELAHQVAIELARDFDYQQVAADFLNRLHALATSWEEQDFTGNICLIGGEGWIANECFITALIGFGMALDANPETVYRRLLPTIETSGDTDSIACVAGWMIGTHFPLSDSERDYLLQHLEPGYAKWFDTHICNHA